MKTYRVWAPDRDQDRNDYRKVKALDHEDAAKVWAERDDAHSVEYSIASGNPEKVIVSEDVDGSEEFMYEVHGEAVPSYWAVSIR